MFTLTNGLKKKIQTKEYYDTFDKSDVLTICDIISVTKDNKSLKSHSLWDIPMRDCNDSEYSDCKLSEY